MRQNVYNRKCGQSLSRIILALMLSSCAGNGTNIETEAPVSAKRFSSPDQAVEVLVQAVSTDSQQSLKEIFGAEGAEIISSGDDVADRSAIERFSRELGKKHSVESQADGQFVLLVGEADWPFPVPIMNDGDKWYFDSAAGKEEILNRRIGENELKTIRLVRSFVEAQKEYIAEDRDGDGVREYAQKALSTNGEKDGLYWATNPGEKQSPFGLIAAAAVREGYRRTGNEPIAFHGYYFKILTAQSSTADGGAKSYLDKRGNMTKGFALLAYPARWSSSGVMSFIVNQDGVVYERDLGVQTLATAEEMKEFAPNENWEPVSDPAEDAVDQQNSDN